MPRLLVIAALAASSSLANAQGVNVTLTEWKVTLSADTVRSGSVTFRINNTGTITHGFYVRGEGVDKGTRDIPAKQSGTLVVAVKPGTYEVFCPMSDGSHKMAGMTKNLVVIAGEPGAAKKP